MTRMLTWLLLCANLLFVVLFTVVAVNGNPVFFDPAKYAVMAALCGFCAVIAFLELRGGE